MLIFPAIDLYEGKAVRLYKGDYNQMTVYDNNPADVAKRFWDAGARCLHLVDLEGAKTGLTPNLGTVEKIVKNSHLFTEIGGGIRSAEVIEKYLGIGVNRVILGTAAIENEDFLRESVERWGEKIAVGADVMNGEIMIKGWRVGGGIKLGEFFEKMQKIGVKTVICTDISRDGAMQGTNRALYRELSEVYSMQIVASGGVSSLDDIRALREMELYGAIIGKAYYTGAIDLSEAIKIAEN